MRKFVIGALVFLASLSFASLALAAWSNPTADPPNGNPDPPLNTGSTAQTKTGKLTISGSGELERLYGSGQQGVTSLGPSGNTHIPYNDGNVYISGGNIYFRDSSNNIRMTVLGGGNVGIGTTNPGSKLHIVGGTSDGIVRIDHVNADGPGPVAELRLGRQGWTESWAIRSVLLGTSISSDLIFRASGGTNVMTLKSGGNVGIGTTAPGYALSVAGVINGQATAQSGDVLRIGNDTKLVDIDVANTAGLYGLQDSTIASLKLGSGGGTISGYNGNVGIGLTNPSTELEVLGTLTVSTVAGDGAGKINAGTVDPIYTIGGKQYATYLPAMTGIKEETAGTIQLEIRNSKLEIGAAEYAYVIDFANAERGSDLWLFWQVTDLGADWENLTVLLTPSFDGKVWYQKDPAAKKLIIRGSRDGEVSYRLTAPRFNHAEWGNVSTDSVSGFTIPAK